MLESLKTLMDDIDGVNKEVLKLAKISAPPSVDLSYVAELFISDEEMLPKIIKIQSASDIDIENKISDAKSEMIAEYIPDNHAIRTEIKEMKRDLKYSLYSIYDCV